jgi:hypothetical protein
MYRGANYKKKQIITVRHINRIIFIAEIVMVGSFLFNLVLLFVWYIGLPSFLDK